MFSLVLACARIVLCHQRIGIGDFHEQDLKVQLGGLRVPSVLFADDVVVLARSDHDLLHALAWFAVKCNVAGMRVSTSKSEVIVLCGITVDCSL